MSWVAVAVAGGTIVGGYLSSQGQENAANTAAAAQDRSSQLGIDESRRQFDAVQKILAPYVDSGTQAIGVQKNILGLNGRDAQTVAYRDIESSPAFQALTKQGEDAILANASATGGLRGGNVQGALAQFRPSLLSQLIEQQYQRLGGLSQLGQASAAGVGSAGLNTGSQIANLLGQSGAAQAGAALAGGRANSQFMNSIATGIGQFAGNGGFARLAAPAPNTGVIDNTLF